MDEFGITREELFVSTKVWNSHRGYDKTMKAFEYHVLQGADHGFLRRDFEQAVSYISEFIQRVQDENSWERKK